MSRFTKHRKEIRLKKAEDQKRYEENSEKFNKSMNDILKTCEYIEKNHPEFDSLDEDERINFFWKIFNNFHKK